jgi:ribosomal protein S18 acetylase RimI-like enzyme
MKLVDVSQRMGERAIQEIFALAVGYPTPEKLADLAKQYESDPSWSAFALFDGTVPTGVIGLVQQAPGRVQIRYIAVSPTRQRSGVGRRLIESVRQDGTVSELHAETHVDAVPFYRRCGFEVTSLGELWPGVERFACCWRAG